ncbi:universal stress protein UspA [Rubidibacter lacunae KORDI 51-2]|uniref:Universal stress protein UspA n=1 Tax=Rubidibacter lacunae KORDI 51-2 TaxID=582515 RepID=U5DPK9_9CHRO|nr:universal stress protein [Rubidibacter lacunae]ERN42539.1 universal stress protein UspA [Rubidibacter lacunae KORDI 51-2]
MSQFTRSTAPFIQSIAHPTDFSDSSARAFAHALAISLARAAALTILHAKTSRYADWRNAPSVRGTLERWGYLEQGSSRTDVFDRLGIRVSKVDVGGSKAMDAVVKFLDDHPTDALVLATEGRKGLPRWLHHSFAEELARKTHTMALFVPQSGKDFVNLATGDVTLRRILVPVAREPDPMPALLRAARAYELMRDRPITVCVLHVGDDAEMPDLNLPEVEGCQWERIHRKGDPVDEIVRVASEGNFDSIAMATVGHHGVLGALRGGTTEQVLHRSPCPLLAIPCN